MVVDLKYQLLINVIMIYLNLMMCVMISDILTRISAAVLLQNWIWDMESWIYLFGGDCFIVIGLVRFWLNSDPIGYF